MITFNMFWAIGAQGNQEGLPGSLMFTMGLFMFLTLPIFLRLRTISNLLILKIDRDPNTKMHTFLRLLLSIPLGLIGTGLLLLATDLVLLLFPKVLIINGDALLISLIMYALSHVLLVGVRDNLVAANKAKGL